MFPSSYFLKRGCFLNRSFHVSGKCFSIPSTEDIVFEAVCVNLRQKRWNFLERILPSLTNSLVSRIICEFQNSPQLVMGFYNRVVEKSRALHSLESCSAVIHVLVNSRRFDDALSLIKNLMCVNGKSPLEVLDALANGYEMCDSSSATFDALVRACTQIRATEGAYEVIMKLQMEGCWVTVHAWNNFLNHLLKLNEIGRFWKLYKEMVSYGYVQNLNTFNLVIYALCKENKIQEAMSVFYRTLKGDIRPNIVTSTLILDGACRKGDMNLALKLFRKMGMMSGEWVKPNSVAYNCLINGFCKLGELTMAEEVRNGMVKTDIEPNVRTYATLIDGYSRVGNLNEGLRLYDELVIKRLVPNSFIYNSIIRGLSMKGDLEGTFLFSGMIDKQIRFDQFNHKSIGRNNYVIDALKFYNRLLQKNITFDAFSHNILINYLCRSNNSATAKQLLASMLVHGFVPDAATFGTSIDEHCKEGNSESESHIYDIMKKEEKHPDLLIFNSIINGLCKMGSVDVARLFVDVLRSIGLFDVITYNTLINGYCEIGKIDEAFALSAEMRNVGISADSVTYSTLIKGLGRLGCFNK